MTGLEIAALVCLGVFIAGAIATLIRTRRLHTYQDIYLISHE